MLQKHQAQQPINQSTEKYKKSIISSPLCELISKSSALDIFPDICKIAKIVLFLKVNQAFIATTTHQSYFSPIQGKL